MACSLPHTDSKVEAFVQKLIDEDKSQSRALIDSFLKEGSDKDYELNLSMYGKEAKLEKQMDAKLAWQLEKYYYRSQESVCCSSSQTDLYLTEKELHQLHLDEEALRETLEEQAMDAKAREEKIRQKQADDDEFFLEFGMDGAVMSTQEYMQKVVEDVDEDDDFNSGVVAIVKSCSPNMLGDLNVTLKDLLGTIPGTIHYKVLDVGSYEKDITVGAAMILANVSVFTPKPSQDYLNITMRNVIEVFRKDTVLESGSG
ncbi:transposase, MuDR, MULE transposase domain protein [Tanacetum coccineum]